MALLSRCFMIIWKKCHYCFKKPDSPEHEQMWIHKRKLSLPCLVLPWQEQPEAICRAGGSHSTMELNSYLYVSNSFEKQTKKDIIKWLAPSNPWIALPWLKCRNVRADKEEAVRWSSTLLRAHLFYASTNAPLSWHGRGDLLERRTWWDWTDAICPGMLSHREKIHLQIGKAALAFRCFSCFLRFPHRLLCSCHCWPQAVLPVRVPQLALTGNAVNPDVCYCSWFWQPWVRLLPQQVPS